VNDGCDACSEPLGDEWAALGVTKETPAIVCEPCRPIVRALDRMIAAGTIDEHGAAAMFERLRWGGSDAGDSRGSDRRVGDVLDLRVRDLELPSPEEKREPCSST
jgi:hypothetical protein